VNALRGLGLWILSIILTSVLVTTLFRERLNDPTSRGAFGFLVLLLLLGGTFGVLLLASKRAGTWANRLYAGTVPQVESGAESKVRAGETKVVANAEPPASTGISETHQELPLPQNSTSKEEADHTDDGGSKILKGSQK
jgi:hypothetical protein